jgi:hypothetical protein
VVLVEALPAESETIVSVVEVTSNAMDDEAGTRFWNLLKGWGLGAAILGFLIGVLALHSRASAPRNLDALQDEIFFHGEILIAPAINHAGTELVYVRTVEDGVGVFLVNLDTLASRQIALAKPANDNREGAVKLFGWSSDDHYLAFSTLQKGKENRNITLCDGTKGTVINTIESPRSVETGRWLAANSLVLIDNTYLLFLLNLEADSHLGQYGNKGFVKLQQLDKTAALPVPDTAHAAIAYVDRGNVWSFDLPANKLTQLTHLTNATISSLDYSGDTYRYLLEVTMGNSPARILYQYDLRASAMTRLTPANFSTKGQWIQDGTGIAYVGAEGGRFFVGVNPKQPALRTNLFTAASIREKRALGYGALAGKAFPEGRDVVRTYCVSPKRDKIYAVAAVDYEPLAIWEYDIAGQTLRNVVPEKNHLNLARFIEPVEASITNQDGKKIDYYHLPPAGMDPRKKYPVVVDQFTDVGYQPTSQFLANAGIFFVAVCKYGQGRGEFPPEPEDTLAVYNEIIKNPNVDPRRIYLIGESAGTAPIANLLTDHPELWRGAIISAAVAFPQFRPDVKQYHTSILFSFGEEDSAANQQRAEKFSQEACAHLMQTRIVYWPGGHVLFDIGTIKKKYKAIASFILTDY